MGSVDCCDPLSNSNCSHLSFLFSSLFSVSLELLPPPLSSLLTPQKSRRPRLPLPRLSTRLPKDRPLLWSRLEFRTQTPMTPTTLHQLFPMFISTFRLNPMFTTNQTMWQAPMMNQPNPLLPQSLPQFPNSKLQ